ncbi:MAG: hypothetical protein P8Z00_03675 [Anaerolineales bacterium]|jgi:hypothetical protein
MGYQQQYRRSQPRQQQGVHPIWRGIGCFLMILIPIMSYAGAEILIEQNSSAHWVAVPVELARTVPVPMLGNVPHFYATLVVMILLMVLGFGVLTVVFAFFWSAVGPSKYGPLDARPVRRSDKPPRRRSQRRY